MPHRKMKTFLISHSGSGNSMGITPKQNPKDEAAKTEIRRREEAATAAQDGRVAAARLQNIGPVPPGTLDIIDQLKKDCKRAHRS
jgi:hypothetical protein